MHTHALLKPATSSPAVLPFQNPMPGSVVTQPYACFNCIGNGKYHTGVDLDIGSDVFAAGDGIVVRAVAGCTAGDFSCGNGYGNHVVLQHTLENGTTTHTLYAHLATIAVDSGCVPHGTKVGVKGSTGFVDGAHLHFALKDTNTWPWPGYVPNHPDGLGFHDPMPYIGNVRYRTC